MVASAAVIHYAAICAILPVVTGIGSLEFHLVLNILSIIGEVKLSRSLSVGKFPLVADYEHWLRSLNLQHHRLACAVELIDHGDGEYMVGNTVCNLEVLQDIGEIYLSHLSYSAPDALCSHAKSGECILLLFGSSEKFHIALE